MNSKIYLDNNAATPVDPRVQKAVCDHLKIFFANPSSAHSEGRESKKILARSRAAIASYLKRQPEEIIFTSGGTEAVNLAIFGSLDLSPPCHIITSSAEHPAVLHTVEYLRRRGAEVSILAPGAMGALTPDAVEAAIKPHTKLITLMAANNETGVKTDLAAVARIAERASISFVVDGVALLGKEMFDIPSGISAIAFSGQKIHGPQGVGFCCIRKGVRLSPHAWGGSQEFGKRAGTENLPGIVGLAQAIKELEQALPTCSEKMRAQRDRFEARLTQAIDGVAINGDGTRIANTSNLSFAGVNAESLFITLDMQGIVASTGSACSSGVLGPSSVLQSMGLPPERIASSLRFSLSRFTTDDEVDAAIEGIIAAVHRLRRRRDARIQQEGE